MPTWPSEEPLLGFVSDRLNEAFFFTDVPVGDDYNDSYWVYNAGTPYNWKVRAVWVDGPEERADERFSVDEINAGAVAWLAAPDRRSFLPHGVTIEQFVQFIHDCGGLAVVIPERSEPS